MLVVPVSEINCRDSRIEYNSNNAIILCNVLSIHLPNTANIANFSQTPTTFPLWKDVRIFWGIGLIIPLSIGSCPDLLVFSDIMTIFAI